MIQNYSRYRILQEFFDSPLKDFQMRELSRLTKIAQPSVSNHLKSLVQDGLIIKETKGLYPTHRANRDSELFKTYKKMDIIIRLREVADFIYDSCMPDVIILFGSAAKGEDTEKSDIDFFLLCKEKTLDIAKYEKKLHRKINLFFSNDINKLSKELKNNILNGIVLKGYLEVF